VVRRGTDGQTTGGGRLPYPYSYFLPISAGDPSPITHKTVMILVMVVTFEKN